MAALAKSAIAFTCRASGCCQLNHLLGCVGVFTFRIKRLRTGRLSRHCDMAGEEADGLFVVWEAPPRHGIGSKTVTSSLYSRSWRSCFAGTPGVRVICPCETPSLSLSMCALRGREILTQVIYVNVSRPTINTYSLWHN